MHIKASCCRPVPVQCQQVPGVLELKDAVAAEAGVAGKGTVEVETMGTLACLW